MTAISPHAARALVEARLDRAPQDALEAAVVLEAWGGVRPGSALRLGAAATFADRRGADRDAASAAPVRLDRSMLAEGLATLIAIVAIALWTGPFVDAIGTATWERAVRIALPLALGLQWVLRSRYVGRPGGLAALRRDWQRCLLALVVLEGLALHMGLSEQVAILLILTWVCGPVMMRRGWGHVYVLALIGVSVAVNSGADPLPLLAGLAVLTMLGAIVAVTSLQSGHDAAGRAQRATAAGISGAAIGGLLVADTSIGWGGDGSLAAIALLPSSIGGFWAGVHLWRLQAELPLALAGVGLADADRRTLRGPVMGSLGGALARLVAITALLSAAVLIAVPNATKADARSGTQGHAGVAEAGSGAIVPTEHLAGDVALLLGFGLLALATLLTSLLHALGHPLRALLALGCGLAVEIGVGLAGVTAVPGSGLVAGALVAVLVGLAPTVSICLRPARVLATTMWIQ